ncbi:MAG: methyl-accepting chemotaxis protein [Syntrophobacteraceae bacterium]
MKNIKLWMKMAIGFGSIILILLILGGVALWNLGSVRGSMSELSRAFLPQMDESGKLEQAVLHVMLEMRGYGITGDQRYLDNAKKRFAEAHAVIKDFRDLMAKQPVLAKASGDIDKAEKHVIDYEAMADETSAKFETQKSNEKKVAEASQQYETNCRDFLSSQQKFLSDDIAASVSSAKLSERLAKIALMSDIQSMGGAALADAWRAQAERSPEGFQAALKEFMEIEKKLTDVKAITYKDVNLKQLEAIKIALESYKSTLTILSSNWSALADLAKKRTATGDAIVEIVQTTSKASLDATNTSADGSDRALSFTSNAISIGLALAVIVAIIIAYYITQGITGPLTKGVDLAKAMAAGDFTQKLDIDRKDEIGALSNALNLMVNDLGAMVKDITMGVGTLASASTELVAISQQMTQGADQTSGRANSVATAAEEMSSNMNSVAAAMEQASTNVGIVASGAEEMTATIDEIARNSEKARSITAEAVSQAKNASNRVDELGTAAQEIGIITETITQISEQTNLLALNATIEAARAGDAGKGFAVVANEIKELAKQTATATEEIKSKIGGIQGSTNATVTEIGHVSQVINDVNDIVATIAAAVEEQSVTTKEIAGNVAQASLGIQEVNSNVAQTSAVAGEIAQDIVEVNMAASDISNSSSQLSLSAEQLSQLAEQLQAMVGKFKI